MDRLTRAHTRLTRRPLGIWMPLSLLVLMLIELTAGWPPARAVDAPVVTTDHTAYPAGDTVTIVASHFLPNDPVSVHVTHGDGSVVAGMAHEPWTTVTDANGSLAATWTMHLQDVSSTGFKVTVSGSAGPVESSVFHRRAVMETERPGYPAGAAIALRGRGFLPGEEVTLQVTHPNGPPPADAAYAPWAVTAAGDGTVESSWFIAADDTSGDRFVLRASGAATGPATAAVFARSGVVQTDKSDYRPGETAVITGYGFAASEDVTLQVTHINGQSDGNGHEPFVTTSDANGAIATTWFVDPDDSLGSKFLLTAAGATSARTASTTFWDAGTISLTTIGATYTQDFSTLAASGTTNTAMPLGWDFAEAGTNANTAYRAGTGSDNTGDTYSYGATGSAERALGGLLSGSLTPRIGVQFTNNTGSTITAMTIGYTGEMWRLGQSPATGRAADRLDFEWSTNATTLTSGTWAASDGLDFASPVVSGTVGALNGNTAANRTALSTTLGGLTIPNGATFWLRWTDADLSPGADDGLAIDDFSLTAHGAAAPLLELSIDDVSVAEGNSGTTAFTFTVRLSTPAPASGVTFDIATANDTATAPDDYASTTATGQRIPAGGLSYTFTVPVAGDVAPENNEAFFVDVTSIVGATPGDTRGRGTIVNDDVADPCALPFTAIPVIQGSGAAAAITGTVTTRGVVVGDYEYPGSGPTAAALRGFYLQDAVGDANPETSDGLFVFNGNNNSVSLGDIVSVTGSASEFQNQTQISGVTALIRCGVGATVSPTDVTFPVASATFLERYEGMLVRLPQTMYVTEHFQLGRFGQVVLSANARLPQPTSVVAPGAAALALQAQNDLHAIVLDDASQAQNPDPIVFARNGQPLSAGNTLRGGDIATGIVGVLDYTWAGNAASGNAYRVRPINALGGAVHFEAANPRPAASPSVGGTLRVASMNLLNFFNTFDGLPDTLDNCRFGRLGGPADCRGADSATEFARQHPKTIAAILAVNPNVLAVNELENDGYGADSAIQFLVNQLNAATAPGTWAFIDADANTGQVDAMGTDAIKSALLYQPAAVTPIGQTAVLNSEAFVNGGDSAPRGRPSIAQAFRQNTTGAAFIVDANHFKSKGSACDAPDAGDGQGNCNVVRTNAARALATWLASDPTGTGDPDVLIVGDLNAYAMEDPVMVLQAAGYSDLVSMHLGPEAYSYAFDGQWGYLDHALASPSLVGQVTGVADHHINADEPSVLDYNTDFKTTNLVVSLYAADQYRVSDHDPVVVGLTLNAPPVVNPGGPYMVMEGGSVTLTASGSDPNGDALVYSWDLDNNGTFETAGHSATFSAAKIDGPASATVGVTATDSGGLSAAATVAIAITNAPPAVAAPSTTPSPSTEGAAVTATASFTDPAGAVDAPFTCTVDYGDGSIPVAGTVTGSTCSGPAHVYATHGSYAVTVRVTDDDGGTGSAAVQHAVIFTWTGFFSPVDNLPVVNVVTAGRAIPVKFSLGGNQGPNIFAAGHPRVALVACTPDSVNAEVEETVTAGGSALSYDVGSQWYHYVWKTAPAWAGTCRELQIQLVDGTVHSARFVFR